MDDRLCYVLSRMWSMPVDGDVTVELHLLPEVLREYEQERARHDAPIRRLRATVRVRAHRVVLCRWSHYFRRIIYLWECRGVADPYKFQPDDYTIRVQVRRYWPYISLLRWMYTGVVALPVNKAERLFEVVQAAVHLKCFDLMRLCRSCFDPGSQMHYGPAMKLVETVLDDEAVRPLVSQATSQLVSWLLLNLKILMYTMTVITWTLHYVYMLFSD